MDRKKHDTHRKVVIRTLWCDPNKTQYRVTTPFQATDVVQTWL